MSRVETRDPELPNDAPPRLPIGTHELLAGEVRPDEVVDLEIRYGNSDAFALLKLLGMVGPYEVVSPWELKTPGGGTLIHAGGYAAVPFGEGHPLLVDFVGAFLESNRQLAFPQQSASEWRAALSANLVALLASVAPEHSSSRVFLTNSGAEAVETAMKMALAFRPKATRFLNFQRAYHGKTLGALALTPNESYQAPFRPLRDVVTVPYGDAQAVADVLKGQAQEIAAIVVEPVLGEGGVFRPPRGFLRELGDMAKRHGVPVIADEVQTGLGRTGHWFASVADGLVPDIVTLAKPLGGAMVPVGATIARVEIYRALLPGTASKRHSNTFGGGSLASAVAMRSLELLVEQRLDLRARQLGDRGLERMKHTVERYPNLLAEARGAGMLFAFTLKPILGFKVPGVPADAVEALTSFLALRAMQEAGVHACYSDNGNHVVRLTPPLTIPDELFDALFDRIDAFAETNPRPMKLLQWLPLQNVLKLAKRAFD